MDVLSHVLGIPKIGGGGGVETWQSTLQALVDAGDLLIWHRYNETTGTTIVNHGSLGANGNGTQTGMVLAQNGQLGSGEAITSAESTDRVVIPNHAGFNALTSFEDVFLIFPTAYTSLARMMTFGDGNHMVQWFGTSGVIRSIVDCATTDAEVRTNTTLKPELNEWALLFVAFDDDTKRIRIRIGSGGEVADCTYSTDTQGVGDVAVMVGDLVVMNRVAADSAVPGSLDEYMKFNRVLTTEERLAFTLLAGA